MLKLLFYPIERPFQILYYRAYDWVAQNIIFRGYDRLSAQFRERGDHVNFQFQINGVEIDGSFDRTPNGDVMFLPLAKLRSALND